MIKTLIRNTINKIIELAVLFSTTKNKESGGVLIIKLEVLGDFILFLPTLKYYREFYQGKKITLLVDNKLNSKIAKRYKESGLIDEIIILDSHKFAKNIFYRFSFSRFLHKQNFSIAIYNTYYRRFLGDFLIKISGAKEKIGFLGFRVEKHNDRRMIDIYSKTIKIPKNIKLEFERNKYFLEKLMGKEIKEYRPEFIVKQEDNKFNIQKPYAVIFPGSGRDFRQWPSERFAEICKYLISRKITPVITGSTADKKPVESLIKNLGKEFENEIIDLSEKTNIFELASVLKDAKFYFGNDTGVLHLAVAVNCPTLCILGGGSFDSFYPYCDLKKNIPIFWKEMTCKNDEWKCEENSINGVAPCINAITVEQARKSVKTLLNNLE